MPKHGMAVEIVLGRGKPKGAPYGEDMPEGEEEDMGGGGCEACLEEAWTAVKNGDKEGFMAAMMAAMDAHQMED